MDSATGDLIVSSKVDIRQLNTVDIPQILRIERACFDDPWPAGWFHRAIRWRDICRGIFVSGMLAGYLIAFKESSARIHLANFAVDLPFRRQGVGAKLLESLMIFVVENQYSNIYLEVRRSNAEAIRFYEKNGFRLSGEEIGYYEGTEDALIYIWVSNGVV